MTRSRLGLPSLLLAIALAGCGSNTTSQPSGTGQPGPAHRASHHASPHRAISPALRVLARFSLPSPRSGAASADYGSSDAVIGGLDAAGSSTTGVFLVRGPGSVSSSTPLPGAVHDAAAAAVDGRLLLFGGGPSEGSNEIVQVLPGAPHLVGRLPVALSDLCAVTVGHSVLVAGGWDGTNTNARVFDVDAAGRVAAVGRIPTGVRYPAVGAFGRHLIVAGGELADGNPTAQVWSFDPANGASSRLPDLPAPIDHGAGVTLNGFFYEIGGLRRGVPTDQVLALAPGARHWQLAGRLPAPVTKPTAATLNGSIAVYGGAESPGPTAAVTLLRPAP